MSCCKLVDPSPEQIAALEKSSKENERLRGKCFKVFLLALSSIILVLSILALQGRIDGVLCASWVVGLSAPIVLGALMTFCEGKRKAHKPPSSHEPSNDNPSEQPV